MHRFKHQKHQSFDGLSSRNPIQGYSKRGSFSLESLSSGVFIGGRHNPIGNRFQRGEHTQGLGFGLVNSGSTHDQRSARQSSFYSACSFYAKFHDGLCQQDGPCIHCAVSQYTLRVIALIEYTTWLRPQDRVLSFSILAFNKLVGIEDRIHRQTRLQAVLPALESNLHSQSKTEFREDDHLPKIGSLL